MAVKSQTTLLSKTINNISDILLERTRSRKNLSNSILGYKRRREQEEKRQHVQDEISATSMVLRPGGSRSLSLAQTGESFINRIIGFIGYTSSGWILSNMPTWIAGAKELSKRISSLNSTFTGFVQNIGELMSDFGSLSDSFYRNLITFDLSDSNSRVSNSLFDLNNTLESMGNQINEAFNVLTEPFTNVPAFGSEGGPGAYPGVQPAPVTPGQPSETPQPSGSGGGGKYKPLLDLISSGESPGGGYSAMFPSESYPQILNMSINEVIQFQKEKLKDGRISAAIGRYQMLYPEKYADAAGIPLTAKFSPENQDKMAIAYLKKNRKLGQWEQGKISDESFSEELAREFGAFKSATGYVLPGNTGSINFNKLKPVLKKIKSGSSQTQTAAKPTPAQVSSAMIPTTVIDDVNVAAGGIPSVGRSGGRGEYLATREGKIHRGIDIGTMGQKGYYVAFKMSGTVTYAGWNKGGFGNLVIIKSGNLEFFFAHLAKVMVKNGSPYNGETIGEIGNTGNSQGEHLHFEVRVVGGRDIDPEPYLKYLSIGKKTTNISAKPTPTATLVPQTPSTTIQTPQGTATIESESKSILDELLSSLTTERKGQQIVLINDIQPQSRSTTMVSSGGGSSFTSINESEVLNNFIKNKLLLDLNYL